MIKGVDNMNLQIETTRLILRPFTETDATEVCTAISFKTAHNGNLGNKDFK
jgi:hypothetical protein